MFRSSQKSHQLSLFSSTHTLLKGKCLKIFEDNYKWHNQFRIQVLKHINEDLFRPLFRDNFGAPNASIRLLIGMMILKEAQGWSDSQLFEQCQFNLLVRSALGLHNIDDELPAASTYYLLRRRIVDWEKDGNDNLMEKVFAGVTKSQVIEFKIHGNNIRMDSKLLGSNIACYSRYELIHETVRKTYGFLKSHLVGFLSASDIMLLEHICVESGDKVSYRSNKSEIESKLAELGVVIYKIISQMNNDSSELIPVLRRVFNEQYQVVEDMVSVRAKEEISAGSIQSPHDTDCHFRKKDENKVKGYSINVTETCDTDSSLNLVTNVIVDTASASDCAFLQSAAEATAEVVTQQIKTINADGAYHSEGNQDYCQENSIDLVIGAIQGKPSRYDLKQDEAGELTVTDLSTNTEVAVRKVESRKEGSEPKWAIRTENDKCRYFTQKEINTCTLRKKIAARPQSELNRRNNVEATIFQLGYHYSNDKSRYRGLIKHKMWANTRCMWINFVRILNFIAGGGSKCIQNTYNQLIMSLFVLNFVKIRCAISLVRIFLPHIPENRFERVFVKNDFL
jgi:hypothetical protein